MNYKMYEEKDGTHFIFILINLWLISIFDTYEAKILLFYFGEIKWINFQLKITAYIKLIKKKKVFVEWYM